MAMMALAEREAARAGAAGLGGAGGAGDGGDRRHPPPHLLRDWPACWPGWPSPTGGCAATGGRRIPGRSRSSASGLAVFWLVVVASSTVGYLSPVLSDAVDAIGNTVGGEDAPAASSRAAARPSPPRRSRPARWRCWPWCCCSPACPSACGDPRRYMKQPFALLFGLAAVGFFCTLALRLAPAAWETANRSSEFLFIGLAFLVACACVEALRRWPGARLGRPLLAAAIALVLVGGAISGWPWDSQLAQPLRARRPTGDDRLAAAGHGRMGETRSGRALRRQHRRRRPAAGPGRQVRARRHLARRRRHARRGTPGRLGAAAAAPQRPPLHRGRPPPRPARTACAATTSPAATTAGTAPEERRREVRPGARGGARLHQRRNHGLRPGGARDEGPQGPAPRPPPRRRCALCWRWSCRSTCCGCWSAVPLVLFLPGYAIAPRPSSAADPEAPALASRRSA